MYWDLYHATPIRMGRKSNNLAKESGDNKLNMIFWDTFNALLDNMVSILITYTAHDMPIKLFNHFNLLVHVNYFNSLKELTKFTMTIQLDEV